MTEVFRLVMTRLEASSLYGALQFLYHIDTKRDCKLQLGKVEVLEITMHADGDAVWASHVWGRTFLRVGGAERDMR